MQTLTQRISGKSTLNDIIKELPSIPFKKGMRNIEQLKDSSIVDLMVKIWV